MSIDKEYLDLNLNATKQDLHICVSNIPLYYTFAAEKELRYEICVGDAASFWIYFIFITCGMSPDSDEAFNDDEVERMICNFLFHTRAEAQKYIDDNWKNWEDNKEAIITLLLL